MVDKSLYFNFCIAVFFIAMASYAQNNIEEPKELSLLKGFKNPIGFYNSKPTFSWKLSVSEKIKLQSTYQVMAASSCKIENNSFYLDGKMPPNTGAKINIPNSKNQEVFENEVNIKDRSTFKIIESDNKVITIVVKLETRNFQTKL